VQSPEQQQHAYHVSALVQVMLLVVNQLLVPLQMDLHAKNADVQLLQLLPPHAVIQPTVSQADAVLTGDLHRVVLAQELAALLPHAKTQRAASLVDAVLTGDHLSLEHAQELVALPHAKTQRAAFLVAAVPTGDLLSLALAQERAALEVVAVAVAEAVILILILISMTLPSFNSIRTQRLLLMEHYVPPLDLSAQLMEMYASVQLSPTQIQQPQIIFQSLTPSLKKWPKPDTA
jgi:hypothetical protein